MGGFRIGSSQANTRGKIVKLLLLLSLPYLATSINIDGFVSLLPLVRQDFGLTRAQVGLYTTFFFAGAAVLAIFAGSLVDRVGSRRGILLGLSCMGCAMLLYGVAPSYSMILFLAIFAGLGLTIITPSVNRAVLTGAPPGRRATSMGVMQSGIGIGGFTGASLLPVLGASIGWRSSIQGTAALSIVIAIIVFFAYRDEEEIPRAVTGAAALKEDLISLFADRDLLCACIMGTVYGSVSASVIFHYTVFLSEDLHLTAGLAGLGLGLIHIGGIAGRPIWGWLSDGIFGGDRARTMLALGVLISGLYFLVGMVAYGAYLPLSIIVVLSLLLGLSVLSWIPVYFVTVGELAGEGQVGTATGLAMVFNRSGMLLAPPLFGLLADATGTYQAGWLLLGAIMAIAAPGFYLWKNRRDT